MEGDMQTRPFIATLQLIMLTSALAVATTAAAQAVPRQPRQSAPRDRQIQMQFRGMDSDGDGVITRAEWRGNNQSFRNHDTNRDGVLSGEEIWEPRSNQPATDDDFNQLDRNNDGAVSRSEWRRDRDTFDRLDRNNDGVIARNEFPGLANDTRWDDRPPFADLDWNRNGVITAGEWKGAADDFRALDTDNDGVLSEREYRQNLANTGSPAYRAGRDRGMADGRKAGQEDRTINGGKWDLDGQRELETADAGYNNSLGSLADYQAGYRIGFRGGYRDGFGPR
jgi:Ca2+-binding EF-hand superfamily protein